MEEIGLINRNLTLCYLNHIKYLDLTNKKCDKSHLNRFLLTVYDPNMFMKGLEKGSCL